MPLKPFAQRVAELERMESMPLDSRGVARRALLEERQARFVGRLRARIRQGRYTRQGLRRSMERHTAAETDALGYDALDVLFSALFIAQAPAVETRQREPEMVFYQPTPARRILQLIDRGALGPQDHLFDLGSGLGLVVQAVALLSGARATGIEVEEAYHECALASVRALGLEGVHLIRGDARDADLGDGNAYFLYTPFQGTLLQSVLGRLSGEAAARKLRLFSYGPLNLGLAHHPDWTSSSPYHEAEIAVFQVL